MGNYFDKYDDQRKNGNYFDKNNALRDNQNIKPSPVIQPLARPVPAPDYWDGFAKRKGTEFVRGIVDMSDGLNQFIYNNLPEGAQDAIINGNNWLAERTPSWVATKLPDRKNGGINADIAQREANYQAMRAAAGDNGLDTWRFTGGIVPTIAAALASGGTAAVPAVTNAGTRAAATLSSRMAGGSLFGGASALAFQPVTDAGMTLDDYWGQKRAQVGLAMGLGGLFPLVGSGLARMISPKASLNPDIPILVKENIPTTVGQTSGGVANWLERVAQSTKPVGQNICDARQRGMEALNNAPANQAIEPLGRTVPASHNGVKATEYAMGLLEDARKKTFTRMGDYFKGSEPTFSTILNSIEKGKAIAEIGKDASAHYAAQNKVFNPSIMQQVLKDATEFRKKYPDSAMRMQNLTDAAERVLGNDIADSPGLGGKLVDNSWVNGQISGIPGVEPIFQSLYSEPAQQLLRKALTARHNLAPAAAKTVAQSTDLLSPAAGLLGSKYMSQNSPPRNR